MPLSRLPAAAALASGLAFASPAAALDLIGLTDDNQLLLMTDSTPGATRALPIDGTDAPVLGIDIRPADLKLYGVTAAGTIYTIDTGSGQATRISSVSEKLESTDNLIVDFNPKADRLRLMTSSGQNLRVNVETGAAAVDGRLAYAPGDRNAGKQPGVLAGAYINAFKGTTQTQLFDVDSTLGTYVVQDPPNDGVLKTIAPTGLPAGTPVEAIDILTDRQDEYHGFAVSGNVLYSFPISRGTMTEIGRIASGGARVIDIAAPVMNR